MELIAWMKNKRRYVHIIHDILFIQAGYLDTEEKEKMCNLPRSERSSGYRTLRSMNPAWIWFQSSGDLLSLQHLKNVIKSQVTKTSVISISIHSHLTVCLMFKAHHLCCDCEGQLINTVQHFLDSTELQALVQLWVLSCHIAPQFPHMVELSLCPHSSHLKTCCCLSPNQSCPSASA